MTTTEFWLAWLFNLRGLAGGVAFILGIIGVGLGMMWYFTLDPIGNGDVKIHSRIVRGSPWFALVFLICAALASAPDPQDMWKLRIALLKLEVASPENVQKVGGHVEEIVKALECKHLQVNCPVPEK